MNEINYDIENDGLSPPKTSAPEPVDGAKYYEWDPATQSWFPVFEEQ